ncbi:TlpA family protein disulfide reductase [Aquimarina pacifica]|uniref:TlpA family protein disulfide reductase n=1 Tax=Aquimarina pacifica TaxID=1296415 RepID=UPI0004712DA1|nr:hypothetical protein [Aquimarina pacifica]
MPFIVARSLVLTSLLHFLLVGCSAPENTSRAYTYFGGEIVNPLTDYVVLRNTRGHKDTILLDKNNRFLHKIENVEDGLYSFKHNPEHQIMLIEKGDSILIRVNTLEFDESLVFTGIGARKNNFLIDVFLKNETDLDKLKKNRFAQTPELFKENQDSILKFHQKSFQKLVNKYQLTDLAKKVTESSFIFGYYNRHEQYFKSQYDQGNQSVLKEIPASFYAYRNQINFNDSHLKRLYSYNRFLHHYFTNLALTDDKGNLSKLSTNFKKTQHQLNLIDCKVENPNIKNNLLRRSTLNFLLNSKNNIESDSILTQFLATTSNKKSRAKMTTLYHAISKLRPNSVIPDQELVNLEGETVQLSSLFNKPITALYFWSMNHKNHYVRAHQKATYLNTLYPDINFIAVNIDDNETENWLNTVKRHQYNLNQEYGFKYPKCSFEELVIHYRNKVILVDNEGKIINARADLFASIFEKQLMQYTQLASIEN